MSERFKAADVEGTPPVLYIVCSHGHKLRRIAKVIAVPRFDPKTGTYRPDAVAAIYTDRRSRDIFDAPRLYAQAGTGASDDPSADIPPELHAGPHLTYTFRCGARGCSPVTLKEENLARLYAAFTGAGRGACELDALAATINK